MSLYSVARDIAISVASKVVPPIMAEVTYLKHENMTTPPGSSVIIISAYPWRYHVKIELTNRTSAVAFVKRATLSLNGAKALRWRESEPIRLEPREPKVTSILFSVSEDHDPVTNGEYVIELTPSLGRATTVKGRLPIKDSEE